MNYLKSRSAKLLWCWILLTAIRGNSFLYAQNTSETNANPELPLAASVVRESKLGEFNKYYNYSGIKEVENKRRAKEILSKAAEEGEEWAKLTLASMLEGSDPKKSLKLYIELAVLDNCLAQERLARAYFNGNDPHLKREEYGVNPSGEDFVGQDWVMSYFWILRATFDKKKRQLKSSQLHGSYFDNHKTCPRYDEVGFLGCSNRFYNLTCNFALPIEYRVRSNFSEDELEKIQGIASDWKVGTDPVPELQKISDSHYKKSTIAKDKDETPRPRGRSNGPPNESTPSSNKAIAKPIQQIRGVAWAPVARALWGEPLITPLQSENFFEKVSKSVWMVFATNSGEEGNLGSAVAIAANMLLTNCHVVAGYSRIAIKNGKNIEEVSLKAANFRADKCVLQTKSNSLLPVPGMREFKDLRVGEEVYAIGSPKGLEATLSQGIISGLRKDSRGNLLQITAPISSGSSGGGVFDKRGNFIGISTFLVKEAQNINFAISADEFFEKIK